MRGDASNLLRSNHAAVDSTTLQQQRTSHRKKDRIGNWILLTASWPRQARADINKQVVVATLETLFTPPRRGSPPCDSLGLASVSELAK